MNYNKSCVSQRSMPFWCVGNPLADPFGGPIQEKISSVQVAEVLAWAAHKKYIEATSAHDDDLVPWDMNNLDDDLDPKSETSKTLQKIKATLDKAGIEFNTISCCLHGDKIFRDGGLCNPDPKVRKLVAAKVARTLRIGSFLGARHFTYWVARDGFEVPAITQWNKIYDWLADGLNFVTSFIEENKLTNYVGATIEPKPNEPRGQMFLPTSGHAVGFILGRLNNPDFWGVNPELLQHESMCLLNSVMTVSYLTNLKKLKFLHFGSQIKGQFDNDFPPLIGPEGLKETVMMFAALNQIGWKGIVEYDCHMLRTDGDPKDVLKARKQFVADCTKALAISLDLADRIKPASRAKSMADADLTSIMQLTGLNSVKLER
ncbi:MAG: TIM barrel protein [Planctomycetia bacterium]|nr:TIM barrel protein [Planctomycetia bacterium]